MMNRPSRRVLPLLVAAVVATGAVPWLSAADGADVEFVIGGYLPSEGGSWSAAGSPLREPFGIDFDSAGAMYIVELTRGWIHRRTTDGTIETLSATTKGYSGDGGPVGKAQFNGPHNCVVGAGNQLLVADSWNHCVRRIDLSTLRVGTLAGTGRDGFSGDGGPAGEATFNFIMCIALDPRKRTLHVADLKNRRVRNISLDTGIVRTVAGNGQRGVPADRAPADQQPLVDPRAVASDASGNLYVLERGGHALRVVRPDGKIFTVAGNGKRGFRDGPALDAQFAAPKHLACDPAGSVYVADDLNGAIRKYDPRTQQVSTLLGSGHGDRRITLKHPHGVQWLGNQLYVLDTGNHRVLKLSLK